MSKKDSANTVVEETNNVVKEDVKLDESLDRAVEAISTLRAQLSEHLKQEQYHHTMSVKAQGALEVLLQLHPEDKEETK